MSDDHGTDAQEVDATLAMQPRRISEEQMLKFEGYAVEILAALGMNLNTPATAETPHRFIRALYDATEGYEGDPKLIKVFATECRGGSDCQLSQIVEGPIPFVALCEHHALPFYGQAYVGYIAHEHIIGISKLTPPRAAICEAVCRSGTNRPADCRHAQYHDATPWRCGLSGSAPSLRGNAGSPGNDAHHANDSLARRI